MSCNTAVILAAGAGTRMKSDQPKVLHDVMGRPMVSHVVSQVRAAGAEKVIAITGHCAEQVQNALAPLQIEFAYQEEQLGTAHAVLQAFDQLPEEGDVFVLCGDTPLITADTLQAFAACHAEQGRAITVLTAEYEDPTGYGRIVRDKDSGELLGIVEQKDANEEERKIHEVNAGMYCIDAAFLREYLPQISNENAQHEYYITDLIEMAVSSGRGASAFCASDASEIQGVNNRVQLSEATAVMKRRIARRHMLNGVTMIDPESVYIEDSVVIGPDTVIWPGAVLRGSTVIGRGCTIGRDCTITDSVIDDGADLIHAVIIESRVGARTHVGPFAYLRPGNVIGEECKLGDFVEFKNSSFGDGSKASHLAYVGDADVGDDVNIGCGVIFVNYDGVHKHRSTVGDRAFIGSNSNLVAPVTVQDDAYVAAGTTVTTDVREGALCVGRARETQLDGWVERKNLKKKPRNKDSETAGGQQ